MDMIIKPNEKNSKVYAFVKQYNLYRGDLTTIKEEYQKNQRRTGQKSSTESTDYQSIAKRSKTIDAGYIRTKFDQTLPEKHHDDSEVLSQTVSLIKPSHTALAGGVLSIPFEKTLEFIDAYAEDVACDFKSNFQSKYDQHGQHSLSEFGYAEAFPMFIDWDAYFGHVNSNNELNNIDQDLVLLVVKICQAAIRRYYASMDDEQWRSIGSVCVLQTLPRVAYDAAKPDQAEHHQIAIDCQDSNLSWMTEAVPEMMSEHSQSSLDAYPASLRNSSSNLKFSSSISLSSNPTIPSPSESPSLSSSDSTMIKESTGQNQLYNSLMKIKTTDDPESINKNVSESKHSVSIKEIIPITQSEGITTKRYKVGIHMHFWKLIVNVEQAAILRRVCIAELASNLNYNHTFYTSTSLLFWGPFRDIPYLKSSLNFASKVWEAMIDEAVYHPVPHCRMFGSHKVKRKLCQHCLKFRNFNCMICGGGRALTEGHAAIADLAYMLDGTGSSVQDARLNQLINHQHKPSWIDQHLKKFPLSIWKGRDHDTTLIQNLHAPFLRMKMVSANKDHLIKYIKFILGRTMIRLPIDPVTSIFHRHLTPGFDPSVDGLDITSLNSQTNITKSKTSQHYTILVNMMCENALIKHIRSLNPAWSALHFGPFVLKNKQWIVECHGVGSRDCLLSKTTHSRSTIYFIITPYGITQACHSIKPRIQTGPCSKNKHSPIWEYAPKIAEILFPEATGLTVKPKYNAAMRVYDHRSSDLPPAKRHCGSIN